MPNPIVIHVSNDDEKTLCGAKPRWEAYQPGQKPRPHVLCEKCKSCLS